MENKIFLLKVKWESLAAGGIIVLDKSTLLLWDELGHGLVWTRLCSIVHSVEETSGCEQASVADILWYHQHKGLTLSEGTGCEPLHGGNRIFSHWLKILHARKCDCKEDIRTNLGRCNGMYNICVVHRGILYSKSLCDKETCFILGRLDAVCTVYFSWPTSKNHTIAW